MRADGSGTTQIFKKSLAGISPEFLQQIGTAHRPFTAPNLPPRKNVLQVNGPLCSHVYSWSSNRASQNFERPVSGVQGSSGRPRRFGPEPSLVPGHGDYFFALMFLFPFLGPLCRLSGQPISQGIAWLFPSRTKVSHGRRTWMF